MVEAKKFLKRNYTVKKLGMYFLTGLYLLVIQAQSIQSLGGDSHKAAKVL